MSNRYYKISSLLKEKCNDNILHTKTETTPLNIEEYNFDYKNKELHQPYKLVEETNVSNKNNVKLEWSTSTYSNTSDPEVWGPSFWFILHNGAARYPENPTQITKDRMKDFILGMPVMIPCEKCADHATSYIEFTYNNFDKILSNRTNLFNFFVDFHNKVNVQYGKPTMNYEDAWKIYSGSAKVSKLKYE